jgi:transposase-like protein
VTAWTSHEVAKSVRIRCWYHKMGNIRSKLPAEGAEEDLAHVRAVRDAPTHEAGEQAAAAVLARFGDRYPAAMACLADDLEASLASNGDRSILPITTVLISRNRCRE